MARQQCVGRRRDRFPRGITQWQYQCVRPLCQQPVCEGMVEGWRGGESNKLNVINFG